MLYRILMRLAIVGLALGKIARADEPPQIGKVFQSHSPDGRPYLVVTCLQADQCFESAYQFCEGPYRPLDKTFAPMGGFRFVCPPKRKRPNPVLADPNTVKP